MKNFGTIIDNFDAVTKQYVDNKVPTDEHIKGIKVDNATLADTAKKVQNAFTYKAHDKTNGTAVSISYDGSEAASLDFVADDFAPVYTSGNDLGLKLVDKGYATKTYVDNQDALKLDKAGGSITGNLTVGGNLTINGTTTTVDSTTLQVKDKLIEVAHGNTTTLTTPAGLVAPKYDGTNSGALVFDSAGTAYVGDVTLKDGNIDVANSDLQPLATRTGLVGGNLVQYDSSAQTLKDSGKKISDLALKTDIPTNYVTTENTTQNIGGKKTVVTPPDTDDSTQIANTAWVRSHNQAIRGFDGVNYYTVNNVKHYYPDDNYFLVAYTDHCVNWQPVCAEMDVVDFDTRRAVYKLKVSGLLESATSNNITTYTNKGNIGVTDSFGERLNTGSTDINNDFFLVCRTTNKGRVRYEIWYNQRYAYNRHKFYFSVDEAHARTGVTQHFTWNKMRVDNAVDVNYAKAGVTAYMESGNINPTYIPTSSWGVDVFKTALSNDESYTNVTIFNNNLYSTTQVGVSTILNTTPYIDAKIKGYSGYKTIPTAAKTAEYRILSEDKGYLGGIRYDRGTDGYSTTRLSTCSTLSGANNAVALYASKGTATTKNTDTDIWSFIPLTHNNVLLGSTTNRWHKTYTNRLNLSSSIAVDDTGTVVADSSNGISFAGTQSTTSMIRFANNNANTYGNGIVIGGGGVVLMGCGESADALYSALVKAQISAGKTAAAASTEVAQSENTYISSDNHIRLFSNCNNIANRKELEFNSSGQLVYTPTAGGTAYTYTLPTKTGTLALTSQLPTKTSELTNDSGFLTSHQVIYDLIFRDALGNDYVTFTANESGTTVVPIDVETINETTQEYSLAIGGATTRAKATGTYSVALGSNAQARYTNTVKIGYGMTPNTQSVTQINTGSYTSAGRALYLGAGRTGFTYMNAAGSSWTSASDIRDKTDIKEIDHALDFIKKLKPITYVMNDRERYLIRDEDDNPILDENGKQQYDVEAHKRGDKKKHRRFAGLSAQDTYQAMLDCYNNDTNYAQIVDNNKFDHPDDEYLEQYSMSYERLVPFLIKAIQEQQEQIEKLKSKLGE